MALGTLMVSAQPVAAGGFEIGGGNDGVWSSVERPDEGEVDMRDEIMDWQYGGRVEVNYQSRSGNTDRSSMNSRFLLAAERENWSHAVELRTQSATDAGETDEERYFLALKSEYEIRATDYIFGAVNFEKDRIQNIDLETTEAVGYGRRILKVNAHRLDAEIGAGGRQTRFRDETPRTSETIMRLATDYRWDISDTAQLNHDTRLDIGVGGTDRDVGESITTLSGTLVGDVSLNLSYAVRYDSARDGEGETSTDRITSVGLSYRF